MKATAITAKIEPGIHIRRGNVRLRVAHEGYLVRFAA